MAKRKTSSRKSTKRKYGPAASKSVESAMRRRKRGTLKSGKGGRGGRVKSRQQAIAIGLSEARDEGAKVPAAPKRRRKKSAAKSAARTGRRAKRATTRSTKRATKRTAKRATRSAKRTVRRAKRGARTTARRGGRRKSTR